MIRVTVELIPFGDEEGKKIIGTMNIVNDGTGDQEIGNYMARMEGVLGKEKTVQIKNHIRQEGVWRLIRRALIEMNQ
jgi:hypothetical protein